MIKDLKRAGLAVLFVAIIQVSAYADDAWNDFKDKAKNAGENSTISVPSDLQADGTSAGFLQKNLKIDFNNHTINGSNYTSDAPLIFSGAGGQNDTRMYIENATFAGFNVGDNGVLNNTNPHLELTDVSFTNNIGRAINNNAYNQLIISAINNNVTISNDYSGDGIYSKSSIYLNAERSASGYKTLRIDDNIKIENSIDGNLNINNSFKSGHSLDGTVFLNGKIDISGQVMLGANVGYRNGILKLGVTPANSDNFKLFVGGEATLDLQNDNIDTLTMGLLKGNDESSPLHLKLDYNAETGKMDIINVENSAISGSPSLIVDEINILVSGDATNTNYLSGGGINLIKVSKDTLSAMKDGKTYIFKPDSTNGSYIVSKAKNITTDLTTYIQTDPPTNEKEVAITSDIVLNADLGTLVGTDRETTIFGNGHTIDGNYNYNGVSVGNGQKFGFNNIKLKAFNDYAIKNNGEVNLTSVEVSGANIINTKTLNLYGENVLNSIIGKDEYDNKVGDINILSGTTNIVNGLHADKLNIGSDDTNIPRATFKNYGSSQINTVTIKNANLVNEKNMEINKIITNNAKIRNDGEYLTVRDSLNISSDSILENIKGVVIGGGNIINNGKIINNGGKIESNPIDNYGEITSRGNDITYTIYMKDANAVYNITGGSLDDNTKINGSQGNVNILGEVMVGAEDFQTFTGKTTVKSGAELVITSVMPNAQNTLFSLGDLVFEDNSTLNLINSASNLDYGMKNDNIVINAGDTLNLKINDKSKLKFINYATREGNISITDLEVRQNSPTSWTVIEDDLNEIYRRTSLADNFKLIKRDQNAQVNYVMYDNTNGTMNLGNTNLNDLLKSIAQTSPSKSYSYDMTNDENIDNGIMLYDNSTVIVQGNNKTLNFENNARLDFGGQSEKNRIVFNNLNMNNAYLGPDSEGQLVINNDSGNAITLNDTTIDDRSLNGGTKFTGNSDINFNGNYINELNRSGTKVLVDLNGATLTKDGVDENANWYLHSGTLKYLNDSDLANGGNNSIYFNGGNLDLRNGITSEIPLANIGLTANSNIYVDVDLANQTMDKLTASNSSYTSGKLNVAGMTLLSDANDEVTTINFTNDSNLIGNVEYTGTETVAYSPIFKYNVSYDNIDGNFTFARGSGGSGGNPSSAYNPAVLATPVTTQVGGYLTQLNTYEQAFTNQDMLMSMTNEERTAMKFANKIASTQGTGEGGIITFSPNQIPEQEKGLWFRPYATFENVGLNNGPNVKNISYGTLVGGDSGIIELKHGWDAVYSAYVGYNGSNQNYDRVSVTQNGGTLGLSGIWYKNNFFTGLTANVGASAGEAHTMYGIDEFAMLSTGIASKTGYNFELAQGKFVIQPNFLMSYSFVNTFDYTNAAGVKISSDPLHAIQIAPGLKFIGNLKNGWQPYVSLQMVWNIMDKSKFMANDVSLPEMSVDPYFQYGLGLQKRMGERFTGFGQAMLRNGGRNGIALQFGFRWAI